MDAIYEALLETAGRVLWQAVQKAKTQVGEQIDEDQLGIAAFLVESFQFYAPPVHVQSPLDEARIQALVAAFERMTEAIRESQAIPF